MTDLFIFRSITPPPPQQHIQMGSTITTIKTTIASFIRPLLEARRIPCLRPTPQLKGNDYDHHHHHHRHGSSKSIGRMLMESLHSKQMRERYPGLLHYDEELLVHTMVDPTNQLIINCRGLGTYGTCAIEVHQGIIEPSKRSTQETLRLSFPPHGRPDQSPSFRLACHIQVASDLYVAKRSGYWGQDIQPYQHPEIVKHTLVILNAYQIPVHQKSYNRSSNKKSTITTIGGHICIAGTFVDVVVVIVGKEIHGTYDQSAGLDDNSKRLVCYTTSFVLSYHFSFKGYFEKYFG